MNLNIINGRVWINSNLEDIIISIKDGKISKLANQDNIPEADVSIDVENNIVFPGCVDVHSHLRDSKFSYKEDFISGTQAAVAGGFTTVLDMPNTDPPIINVKELKKRQNNAKNRIFCNVGFYSSPIKSEDVNQLRLSNAIAFKIYLHKPFEEQDLSDVNLIRIMNRISECDSILAVHAEDRQLFDQNNNHTTESEVHAINRIIKLAKQTDCKIHFVHVSTKEGIEAIKNNKSIVDISCEATPHHMILNTEKINSEKHACSGIDYFVYKRNQWKKLPDFIIGRPGFDNWLIWKARRRFLPVIDGTESIQVVHQNHPVNQFYEIEGDKNKKLHNEKTLNILDASYRLFDGKVMKKKDKEFKIRNLHRLTVIFPEFSLLIKLYRRIYKRLIAD